VCRECRLVRLFETEVSARYSYVWSKNPRNRIAGLAFRDWIMDEMTAHSG